MHHPHHQYRFNIYTAIHKGLRASLCQTLIELGRTDPADTEALATVVEQAHSLLYFCQGHLEHENQFIHPKLQLAPVQQPLQTAQDHLEHERAIGELHRELAALIDLPLAAKQAALLAIYRTFSAFVAENFDHMLIEETHNAEQLWANYSDAQILEIQQALVQSLAPEENLRGLLMMLPHLNHAERLPLLAGVRKGAPAPAYQGLLAMLPPLLPTGEWRKLNRALELQSAAELAPA